MNTYSISLCAQTESNNHEMHSQFDSHCPGLKVFAVLRIFDC